jgi:uncharacterized membrane protein
MKQVLIVAYALSLAVLLVCHLLLPADMAIHFGRGGVADGWAPKIFHTVVFAVINSVLFGVFLLAPRATFNMPEHYIGLPNKDFWLKHRGTAHAILARLVFEFGAVFLAFMSTISLLTLAANHTEPARLNEPLFLLIVAVILLYTVVWCVRLVVSFKVSESVRRSLESQEEG